MGAELIQEQEQEIQEIQEGGVEGYAGTENFSLVGGKRRKGRKGSRRTKKGDKMKKGRKGHKGTRKGTRKGKRPPSKWIIHVKAFCKKTGKNFPQALKDPMCRKTFKH
tara:strand:- start:143 stop:466 length:324 start_codon:yes stop_codon:yes gene_type:complete